MSEHKAGSAPDPMPAHGVQELIARIREEGVQSARAEADRILAEAQEKAARLLQEAESDIAARRERARREIETDRSASIESLKLAARDTALELRTRLVAAFERSVRQLLTLELRDTSLIRDLVVALAGRLREDIGDQPIRIELAEELFEPAEGDSEGEERLRCLVHGLTASTLRDGVELTPASDVHSGARVRLVGEDVELDLTDEALSSLFLEHLLPRFAEMLRGAE